MKALRLIWLVAHRGLLAGFSAGLLQAASNWPQWRGPDGQGNAGGGGYPLNWSESANVTWKTPLPGRGWSSPVIWGNEVWLTMAMETPTSPEKAAERLKSNTNDQPVTLLDQVAFHALCVARDSGKLLHDVELMTERDPQWVHQMNSYASPTPVIEEGRLYCHFGTFGTACVDTGSGTVLWRNTELHLMHENGPGSSPVLFKDKLIFHCDGSDVQYVAALDKQTGKVAWKTDRSGALEEKPVAKATYSTPLLLEFNGAPQLISTGPNWLYDYDPASGKELWKMPYGTSGFAMSAHPVASNGLIFYSTGFPKAQLQAVKYNGTGQPEIAWIYPKGVPTMSSPLPVNDFIYFTSDSGIFTCLMAKNGKQVYRDRLEGSFSASPLLADGRLYFFSREGKTYVLAPGDQLQTLATNALDGQIAATPAAVDGVFFIRTDKALYRIEAKK